MKQGSAEWHEFRQEHVGASDAPIIMGVSKFCTIAELWDQKVLGKTKEVNEFITKRGHDIEEKYRNYWELLMDAAFPPIVTTHKKFSWLSASLDGYNKSLNMVWECKYCGKEDLKKVESGECLSQYYPQIQHQLLVTGADSAVLFCVDPDGNKAHVTIEPDLEYIKDMFSQLENFWQSVLDKKRPAVSINNNELSKLLTKYKKAYSLYKKYEVQVKELKTEIFSSITVDKLEMNNCKVTRSQGASKEVFDAKRYEKENDISNYMTTKKGSKIERITILSK